MQFHVETGGYDAKAERDERSFVNNTGGRKVYRYQVQGPNAAKVMEEATGKPMPDISFFNMSTVDVGGHKVRALRHGMVGQPGWELFGPWAEGDAVRDALVEAGQKFGIKKVGARTYPTSTLESGWIPSPLPAVYSGDADEAVPANGSPVTATRRWPRSAAAYVSEEDRRLLPHALRPGLRLLREVRPRLRRPQGAREDREEAASARKSRSHGTATTCRRRSARCSRPAGNVSKYIDLPLANYSTLPFDKVMKGSKQIGVSTYTGYSFNERSMLSLAIVDAKHAKPGTEVTLCWGEEGRRHDEADRRAPQAGEDSRHRRPRAVRRHGAHGVPPEVGRSFRKARPRSVRGRAFSCAARFDRSPQRVSSRCGTRRLAAPFA